MRQLAHAKDGLVTFGVPVALAAVAVHELHFDHSPWYDWVLELALVLPLVWRRRAPVLVLCVCLAVAGILWARRVDTLAAFSVLVALYSVAAFRDRRDALLAGGVVEVGVVLVALRFAPAGSADDATLFLTGLAAAALFLGTTVRAQRRYVASVEDRALRLEHERAQQAQLAAAEERTRIAREMHDVVAHGLSVVIALSEGAAANATADPRSAQDAMQHVATAGRQSLAEMRRLLGVLRTDDAVLGRDPQPSLESLDDLLADVRRTGLAVDVTASGHPSALSDSGCTGRRCWTTRSPPRSRRARAAGCDRGPVRGGA